MVKKITLYKYSVDYFLFLLKRISPTSKVSCNDKDINSWNNFIDFYKERVDKNFLKIFIEFQMQSWFNDYEKDYKHSIRFNWVIGKNAIARWEKNDIKTNNFIVKSSLKRRYKINKEEKKNLSFLISTRKIEERFKKEFFNSLKGFLWCKANTTLFNHKSEFCVVCNFSSQCKEMLKENFFKIYKIRGYND